MSAGLVTGLFSIPEGLAYASIAGFNPVAGIYAGVVPTLIGSLLTRTVLMVTTLTSAIALTSQSAIAAAGLDPARPENLAALTLLVGLIMVVCGLLRLGVVLSFVSNAVMIGFSTGIAVQIITGVLSDATGYDPAGHNKLVQVVDWIAHIGAWQPTTVAVSLGTIAVWAVLQFAKPVRTLATLIAVVVMSALVAVLGVRVETAGDIARIPAALPMPVLPDLSALPQLFGGALSVALVALAQAAGISPTTPNPDGSRSSVNADFVAQGAANIGGGFFRALPTGGSLSRTGVAVSAGARTRWSGVLAGLWLALLVLAVGWLAEFIPMTVIGGLIIVIGVELIKGRWSDIVLVFRSAPLSAVAMVITFLATTQFPLQQAIVIGAVLSLLLYCAQAARSGALVRLLPQNGRWRVAAVPERIPPGEVTVLYYPGVSLFAEVTRLDEQWPSMTGAERGAVVLVVRWLPDVPSTTLMGVLARYADTLADNGGRLLVAGADPTLARTLRRSGVADRLGPDGVFPARPEIFGALDDAVAEAEAWIARSSG